MMSNLIKTCTLSTVKDENHKRLLHIHWTFATNNNYATVITSYRTFFFKEEKKMGFRV